MSKLLDWIVYCGVRAFFGGIARIPRPAARRFCRWVAGMVHRLDAKHRRVGLVNLAIAFPERGEAWRKRVLEESFKQLADLAVEISRLGRLDPESVRRRVVYEPGRGLENYLAAKREGVGVVFVTAHVGAWELLPLAHALHGHPLSFVVRPLDNPHLERWVSRLRGQCGNLAIPKRQAMRRMLKTVQAGADVGILIDQNVHPSEAVFVPFFDRPAATTPAPASLALKTGAAVVAGFLIPDPHRPGHYQIRFYPPLKIDSSGDRRRDVEQATAHFNALVEEVVRQHPQCWLWGHRRFASQPEGVADPYR